MRETFGIRVGIVYYIEIFDIQVYFYQNDKSF